MADEPNDAWMDIPPLDRLVEGLADPRNLGPPKRNGGLQITMSLKGTEAIFVLEGEDHLVEVMFRYKRRAGAWQMHRREGSMWVAEGPPSARAGWLLEQIVMVMQGADPRTIEV